MSAGHCVHRWWNPFIGMSWHDAVIVPLPGPVPKVPHLSFFTVNGSWLGSYPSGPPGLPPGPGPTVGGGGAALMGRKTDAGFAVPHVPLPPSNVLLPLVILFGESRLMFGSSSVKIPCRNLLYQDSVEDLACVAIPYSPIGFDFGCNEIVPVPLDLVIAPNTIHVGMTGMDFLAGVIDYGLEIVTGAVLHFGGKALKGWVKKLKARKVGAQVSKKARQRASKVVKEIRQKIEDVGEEALDAGRKKVKAGGAALKKARKEWQEGAVEEGRERIAREADESAKRSARAAKRRTQQAVKRYGKSLAEQRRLGEAAYDRTYHESLGRARRKAEKEARKRAGGEFDELVAKEWQESAVREARKKFGRRRPCAEAVALNRAAADFDALTRSLGKELGWGLAKKGPRSLKLLWRWQNDNIKEWMGLSSLSVPPQAEGEEGEPTEPDEWWGGKTGGSPATGSELPYDSWWGGKTDSSARSTVLE